MKEQQPAQHHRHSNQENSRRDHSDSRQGNDLVKKIGQFFGLIYNLAVLALVANLAKNDKDQLAAIIFVSNSLIVVLAMIFIKRPFSKKLPPRNRNFKRPNREPRSK